MKDELLRVLGVMVGEQVRMGRGGLGGSGKGIWIWGGIKRGVAIRGLVLDVVVVLVAVVVLDAVRMGARVGVLGAMREGAMREGARTGITDDMRVGMRVA